MRRGDCGKDESHDVGLSEDGHSGSDGLMEGREGKAHGELEDGERVALARGGDGGGGDEGASIDDGVDRVFPGPPDVVSIEMLRGAGDDRTGRRGRR